jgi:hypothetical protein
MADVNLGTDIGIVCAPGMARQGSKNVGARHGTNRGVRAAVAGAREREVLRRRRLGLRARDSLSTGRARSRRRGQGVAVQRLDDDRGKRRGGCRPACTRPARAGRERAQRGWWVVRAELVVRDEMGCRFLFWATWAGWARDAHGRAAWCAAAAGGGLARALRECGGRARLLGNSAMG